MANEDIIRKNIKNVESTTDANTIKQRFENSLKAVNNLFKNKPPIYATWIRIQFGMSDPLIFDSTSTAMNENLIASLSINQNGSGTVNSFTLTVKYDPFKYGQNTSDKIEALDDLVAQALSVDFDSDLDRFRGLIQYGYSGTDTDTNLISPLMEFQLTKATSNTKFSTGITTYTFEGTSYAGVYCDVTANIGQMTNWKLIDIVTWHLYYYFGSIDHQPYGYDGKTPPADFAAGYAIDIPESYYQDENTVVVPEVNAQSDVSVWGFCLNLLQEYPLTQAEIDSGNYDNLESMDVRERPRNVMYITDEDGCKTIHVRHIAPMEEETEDGLQMIDFDFTWGDRDNKNNLIKEWAPQVDLTTYLIRKCDLTVKKKQLEDSMSQELQELEQNRGSYKDIVNKTYEVIPYPGGPPSSVKVTTEVVSSGEEQYNKKKQEIIDKYYDQMVQLSDQPQEMYNAEITLQGIPMDAPLAVGIRIKPKVLESVSRTAGYYYITTCSSTIDTKGNFSTTLGLFRMRGLSETTFTSSKILAAKKEAEKSEYTNSNNSSNAITSTVIPIDDEEYQDEITNNGRIPNYRQPTNPLWGNTSGWTVDSGNTNITEYKAWRDGAGNIVTDNLPKRN